LPWSATHHAAVLYCVSAQSAGMPWLASNSHRRDDSAQCPRTGPLSRPQSSHLDISLSLLRFPPFSLVFCFAVMPSISLIENMISKLSYPAVLLVIHRSRLPPAFPHIRIMTIGGHWRIAGLHILSHVSPCRGWSYHDRRVPSAPTKMNHRHRQSAPLPRADR